MTIDLESLKQLLPKNALEPSVLNFLKKDCKGPWCVAVSGGADSVCLLLVLWLHFPKERETLTVLHVNHCLRGAASDQDARWVKGLAQQLGVAFEVSHYEGSGREQVTEEKLRNVRFGFLEKHMERLGSTYLFLGHQAQDVAENLLLRLSRGAGISGLSGMRPIQEMPTHWRLRPLLTVDPGLIRKALNAVGLGWREDHSNAQDLFLRNRLRHQVVPSWKDALAGRSLWKGVLRSRGLLEEADAAIRTVLSQSGIDLHGQCLHVEVLREMPKAFVRRGLDIWLWARLPNQTLTARAVETLLDAAMAKDTFKMSAGSEGFLLLQKGYLSYEKADERNCKHKDPVALMTGSRVYLPNGNVFKRVAIQLDASSRLAIIGGHYSNSSTVFLNLKPEALCWVRPVQSEDAYQPLGKPSEKKVLTLLREQKNAFSFHKCWPILCSEKGAALWTPGLPIAQAYKLEPQQTQACMLTLEPSR